MQVPGSATHMQTFCCRGSASSACEFSCGDLQTKVLLVISFPECHKSTYSGNTTTERRLRRDWNPSAVPGPTWQSAAGALYVSSNLLAMKSASKQTGCAFEAGRINLLQLTETLKAVIFCSARFCQCSFKLESLEEKRKTTNG